MLYLDFLSLTDQQLVHSTFYSLSCTYKMHLPILVICKCLKKYIYLVSICQENVIAVLQWENNTNWDLSHLI